MSQEQFEQLLEEQKRTNELLEALLPLVQEIRGQCKEIAFDSVIGSAS